MFSSRWQNILKTVAELPLWQNNYSFSKLELNSFRAEYFSDIRLPAPSGITLRYYPLKFGRHQR